MDKKTLIREY